VSAACAVTMTSLGVVMVVVDIVFGVPVENECVTMRCGFFEDSILW
jgi:hypothetical protein